MEVNNDFLRAIKNGLKVFDKKKKDLNMQVNLRQITSASPRENRRSVIHKYSC